MLSHLSLRLPGRLWAALLALTVLFHATVPFDAPLMARSGSAFSAATTDLAVAPERRLVTHRALLPAVLPPVIELPEPEAPRAKQVAYLWPPQTAPPSPAPLLLRPAPRAPPIA
ncbi:hypothetical protein [Novosphingobium sp. MMS21-SN21R]|uniref:hypothetical protein n=1 Tax=Novosphingobium sp. MMS21-SN21R TaxID=2969298 RepID=UPI00288567EC|nr:hypothetical protein [Novosphingobium sp. MMS21-SN21R]MDT0509341.1 hypothetical protein [Novosphingobium sp. MMS21-SN21R]